MRRFVPLVAALAAGLAACHEEPAPTSAPRTEAPAPNAMCLEHGVLEAVCTECNPKLAAVFQGRGDWCAEHGFPESFCPTCHPERGGRPAVDVAGDGAPPDGTLVVLRTSEAIQAAFD